MSPEARPAIGLALWGATGRMGSEILKLLGTPPGFKLVQAVASDGSRRLGQPIESIVYTAAAPLLPEVEVVVDFSSPQAMTEALSLAREAGKPFVSGTTGLEEQHRRLLQEAAVGIPVFWAPNFSIGIAALLRAVEAVLPLLHDSDLELVEGHHAAKKDAPSGTALKILDALRKGVPAETRLLHGREGLEARKPGDIGVHAVRGGSNPGRHEVHFLRPAEDLVITHQAYSREAFARGALRAAAFVRHSGPGLYAMDSLLGP